MKLKIIVPLAMVALVGCGTNSGLAPFASNTSLTAQGAKQSRDAIERMTILEAVAICSEIERGYRPEGFYMVGKLADAAGTEVTLFYHGEEWVGSSDDDMDVPDDALIKSMKPTNGKFELSVTKTGQELPLSPSDLQAFKVAVKRALSLNPQGKNPQGQSIRGVLTLIQRVIENPKS